MKKHHKLLIGLTIVGVVVLLYLLYKRGQASSSGGGSVDTSSLPTIISTGGGGIQFPSTFGGGAPQTYDATIPGYPSANPAQVAPTLTVMPGTSASGVPAHTDQAQEFNTNNPIAAPSAAASVPSFYASAQDLPFIQPSGAQVQTSSPGFAPGQTTSNPTLESFLQGDVRQYEIGAQQVISNPGVPNQGHLETATELQGVLTGEASQYCDLHPEACAGDRTSLIASLTNAYSDFVSKAQTVPTSAPTGGAYVNPGIQDTANTIKPVNAYQPYVSPAPSTPQPQPGGNNTTLYNRRVFPTSIV